MFHDYDKYDSLYALTRENNSMIEEAFPEDEVKGFISRAVEEFSDYENDRTTDTEAEDDAVSAVEEITVSLKKSKAYRISEMLTQHFRVFSDEMNKVFIYNKETGAYRPYTLKKFRSFLVKTFHTIGRGLSDHLCKEIFAALQSFPGVPIPEDDACFWNENEMLLCCENGVIDLSGEQPRIFPHSPDYRFDYCIKAEYIADEELVHPTWDAYVASSLEGNPEKELLLKQMIGYILSDLSRAKKFLVFLGKVDCGKSVIENFIRSLLPRPSVMSLELNDLDSEFKRVALIGKKVCICHDMKNRRIRSSSEIKSITGGDFVQVAYKGQDVFDVLIRSKLLVSANDFPDLGEDDPEKSFVSRLAVLLFNVSIPPEKQDRELDSKLWNERNAIFSDCVRSLEEFLQNNQRFTMPQDSLEFYDKLKRPTPEESFINERLEFTGSGKDYVHMQTLEDTFSEYCAANGFVCDFLRLKKLLRQRFDKCYGRINRDGKNQWGYSSVKLIDAKAPFSKTYHLSKEGSNNG